MIIHAVSIHSGGGKVLLDSLLVDKHFGIPQILICDERYILPKEIEQNSQLKIYKIKPTLFNRWSAEFLLRRLSCENPHLEILCFSNLPPSFRLKGKTYLYLQNALLLPREKILSSNLKVTLRLLYEKAWLQLFIKNLDAIWVQTSWMKNKLQKWTTLPVELRPFLPSFPNLKNEIPKVYDFITITGAVKHKNLKHLLLTWKLFPQEVTPSLLIVTDGMTPELETLYQLLDSNKVTLKVGAKREDIFEYYQKSKNLILLSELESFCLPLYEAAHFGLKIYSAKRPFAIDSNLVNYYIGLDSPQNTCDEIKQFFIQQNNA